MEQKQQDNIVKQGKNEEVEIDLLELLFVLLEQWKVLVASTVIVALIAFVASWLLITPKYKSTSELYVLSKSTSLTSISDLQIGTSLTTDYMEVISSRPVLEQVITNLGLEEGYGSLKGRISLENPSNSRIMKISVTDTDPKNAKTIADEIAEVSASYISEKMDQDPPTIIQYGYSDNSKVSPNISKNSMIGAVIGFLLAAAVIIVSHLLNDTITSVEELEKNVGINVLGTLPLEEESEYDGHVDTRKEKVEKQIKKMKRR